MKNHKDFGFISNHVIDMLVDSTLQKHGVKLDSEKIDPKEKEKVKNLVNQLMDSVEALNKDNSN